MKTITLLTSGTRGDVQPYLALGQGLQTEGYRALIVAPESFAPMVAQAGLSFRSLDGNPSELMMDSAGSQALLGGSNLARSLRASLRFVRAARPIYERMLHSAWEACQGSAALIVGLPSLWGTHIAEALRVPCIGGLVQPLSRTGAWPSAILPSARSLGLGYNRLTHRVVEQALWQPWRGTINRWRQRELGRPPMNRRGPDLQRLPMVYGFSERVVPRPSDWPPWHHIAGYWRGAPPAQWVAPAALLRFIEQPGPLIYFGFGSPGLPEFQRHVETIAQATQAVGARAIVTIPQGTTGGTLCERTDELDWPAHLLAIREVPHRWLFSRVSAVVHHGGAGTMAEALHAGVPMLVLPRAVDQHFWAQRALLLGIAPQAIPQRKLNALRLTEALHLLLSCRSYSANARQLADHLRQERGVEQAIKEIKLCLDHP